MSCYARVSLCRNRNYIFTVKFFNRGETNSLPQLFLCVQENWDESFTTWWHVLFGHWVCTSLVMGSYYVSVEKLTPRHKPHVDASLVQKALLFRHHESRAGPWTEAWYDPWRCVWSRPCISINKLDLRRNSPWNLAVIYLKLDSSVPCVKNSSDHIYAWQKLPCLA